MTVYIFQEGIAVSKSIMSFIVCLQTPLEYRVLKYLFGNLFSSESDHQGHGSTMRINKALFKMLFYRIKFVRLPSKDMAKLSFSAIMALRDWASFSFSDRNEFTSAGQSFSASLSSTIIVAV